jgi:hypothetical protein
MAEIRFKCHQTGEYVDGWFADEPVQADQTRAYTFIFCTVCDQLHLIDRITGRGIHERDEAARTWPATAQSVANA